MTRSAASTATARAARACARRAGPGTRAPWPRATRGAGSTACAATARVSAPTDGTGATAPWRAAQATAMDTVWQLVWNNFATVFTLLGQGPKLLVANTCHVSSCRHVLDAELRAARQLGVPVRERLVRAGLRHQARAELRRQARQRQR